LLRYRAEHKLSQRALAKRARCLSAARCQARVRGAQPGGSTRFINAVRRLGIEFALDVAPEGRKPTLLTARAQKHGAVAHEDVSVGRGFVGGGDHGGLVVQRHWSFHLTEGAHYGTAALDASPSPGVP